MPLYYLDPDREPRECDYCRGNGTVRDVRPRMMRVDFGNAACARCNGTGRLGVEGAKPEINVFRSAVNGEFWWRDVRKHWSVEHWHGQHANGFPTEAAALSAARAAHEVKR